MHPISECSGANRTFMVSILIESHSLMVLSSEHVIIFGSSGIVSFVFCASLLGSSAMIFKMEFLDTMVDLRACSAGCLFRDGFIFREVIDLISLVHHAGLILERGRLMAVDLLAEVVRRYQ